MTSKDIVNILEFLVKNLVYSWEVLDKTSSLTTKTVTKMKSYKRADSHMLTT
jgi:hypothetical protein